MSFPVNSTSVGTASTERVERVMQRAKVGDGKTRIIAYAGRFVCKKILGSDLWSQHSWGNADDFFPTEGDTQAKLRRIADAVVYQCKHRTVANRGRKLEVSEVIDHDGRRRWIPGTGWVPYTGATGAHIHVSGSPYKSGRPPCAG